MCRTNVTISGDRVAPERRFSWTAFPGQPRAQQEAREVKKDHNEKEIYKLWWEYLKRSEEYKRWLNEKSPQWDAHLKVCESWEQGSAPIVQPAESTQWGKWIVLYHRFGNVHKTKFEKWWHIKEPELSNLAVEDYLSSWLRFDIAQCFANVKADPSDRDTFQREFKNIFQQRLESSTALYLIVHCNAPLKKLEVDFFNLVKAKRREVKVREFRRYKLLIGRIQFSEIKRYLRVFDIWKRNSTDWLRIVSERVKDHNNNEEVPIRRDLKKAKQIIKNVEGGIFPGKY